MAQKITARLRITNRYVDACRHMDEWGDRFTFKLLAGKRVDEGNGFDDLGSARFRVIGSKTADQDKQAMALRQSYSHYGCTHEYDCCGCISTSARVTKVKRGVFSMLLSHSRNY